MENIGYIYKITNPSGKIYIGQTINAIKRKCDYKRQQCKSQCKLYNSIIKYGWENHVFEIIETTDKIYLNDREIYWISHFDSVSVGLNILPGGNLRIFSEESKEKMRQAKLGKKYSTEHKEKISLACLGKKHLEESLEKMKISKLGNTARVGKKLSESHKEKILNSHLGKKRSQETKDKMSKSKLGNKNRLGKTILS